MRGNDSRMIGNKRCDHERKRKKKRQCEGDRKKDRENRDMFDDENDENNEGYKGSAKRFMNNKKTIHERITQAGD